MMYLTKPELRKLAKLCEIRCREADEIICSHSASDFDKALANNEREWMMHLSEKLKSIDDKGCRRIEITI